MASPTVFYVVLACYLGGMLGMALYGLFKKKQAGAEKELETHFLANKGFGVVVIFFNIVATYLTGWVVVGIPTDASHLGHLWFFWILCCSCAGSTFNLVWPRLRRCAVQRNYMGPGDYFGDRFNSRFLTLLCSLAGCVFMLTQQILEWMACVAIFETITKGDIPGRAAVWFLSMFIFMCEMLGGMTSVALTDAIQAAIMVTCYLLTPFLTLSAYNGLDGITERGCTEEKEFAAFWPNLPKQGNVLMIDTDGSQKYGTNAIKYCGQGVAHPNTVWNGPDCTGMPEGTPYNASLTGCIMHNSEWFYQGPPKWAGPFAFSMAVMCSPWSIAPYSIHRVLVAKSDEAIKNGVALVHAYPFCFFTPGILLGLVANALFYDQITEGGAAFPIMAYAYMDLGGFYAFVAILLLTSCVASFMSTADSIVLATSNQLTIDFFQGWIHPHATQTQTLIFSKVTSFVLMCISVLVATEGGEDVSFIKILIYGLAMLNMCWPAFFYGMFFEVHSRSVITGFIAALITMLTVQARAQNCMDNWPFEDGDDGPFGIGNGPMGIGCTGILSPTYASFVGMLVVPVAEFLYQQHAPQWMNDDDLTRWDSIDEKTRGVWNPSKKTLSAKEITTFMREGQEPVQTVLGKLMWCIAYFTPWFLCPWYDEPGVLYPRVAALPRHAARMVFGNIIPCAILIIQSFWFWKGPDSKAEDDKLAKEGRLPVHLRVARMGLGFDTGTAGMRRLSSAMLQSKFEGTAPKTVAVMPASSTPGVGPPPPQPKSNQVQPQPQPEAVAVAVAVAPEPQSQELQDVDALVSGEMDVEDIVS